MAKKRKASSPGGTKQKIPSFWEAQSEAVRHSVSIGVLVAIAFSFYGPALFSGKSLIGSDIMQWRAGAESMLQHREETGEEPLWATNMFAGMPGYVVSEPPKVVQIDSLPRALRFFIWPVSHFIFLLLGAYALVFFFTKDQLSSVFVAVAYGFTTYLPLIVTVGHNTKFVALCYAPWLLLAFAYTLRRPGVLAGLLFAVALAINLRAGHVQITYYLTFLSLVWWIAEGVGAVRHGKGRQFLSATAYLILGCAIALCMVAQIYLLIYEYKTFSIRGSSSGGEPGGLDWIYAMAWSQGVGELITLLIADAFGGSSSSGLYWGPKTFTAGPHYLGGIVLFFAALALWRIRKRMVWALGTAACVMILFSIGANFDLLNRLMFDYFPLFDSFRAPETWLVIVALVLALLAGFGLSWTVRSEKSPSAENEKTRAIYIASGLAVCVALGLFVGKDIFFSFEKPGEFVQIQAAVADQAQLPVDNPRVTQIVDQLYEEQLVIPRREAFTRGAGRTLVLLLLATLGLVLFRRGKVPGWVLQALVVLLVTIDLYGMGRRYFNEDSLTPTRDIETAFPPLDVDEYILDQKAAGESGKFRVLSLEVMDQTKNARPSFHHESLGGYSGAKLRLYQDYLEHIYPDPVTGLPNENALDMLNTRFVIARDVLPGTREVYRGEISGLRVLENPDALPRAFFVERIETISASEETWARLRNPAFDPHRNAILAESIEMEDAPIDSASTVRVEQQHYGPREITWSVTTDQPRLLVISEVFYPAGWRATIDGKETPIHRANHLLRSVSVPAGTHDVVLRFDPTSFIVGKRVSGITTMLVYGGILALVGLAWTRRRRREV